MLMVEVFGVSFDGTTAAVPVPVAAWLFGSALAALTVARRRGNKNM